MVRGGVHSALRRRHLRSDINRQRSQQTRALSRDRLGKSGQTERNPGGIWLRVCQRLIVPANRRVLLRPESERSSWLRATPRAWDSSNLSRRLPAQPWSSQQGGSFCGRELGTSSSLLDT